MPLDLLGGATRFFYRRGGWRVLGGIGTLVGTVQYHLNRVRRNRTESPLQRLLGDRCDEATIHEIVRRSFDHYYKKQIETIFFGAITRERIDRMVVAEGIGHIDRALGNGRGVILLLAHFGFFLLPLPYLGYRGYPVNQIAGKQAHASRLAELVWNWRSREAARLPVRFKQVDRFLRPVYQALKGNEIVAIAFDGRDSAKWEVVDFFGKKVRFSPGPFDLARRTGATIIPTFVVQKSDNTHRIFFEPPFALSADPDHERSLEQDTARFARIFEGYVARHPCHFGMILHNWCLHALSHPESAFFAEE